MTNIALKCCQFITFSTNNSFYQYSSYGSRLPQFWEMFPPHKAEESTMAIWPLSCKTSSLPHQELYNSWKTYGDILKLKLGLICTKVISSPPMAIEVLKNTIKYLHLVCYPLLHIQFLPNGLDVIRWVSQGDTLLAIPWTKAESLWAFVCQLDSSKNVWRWKKFHSGCMSVFKRLQGKIAMVSLVGVIMAIQWMVQWSVHCGL
jgi:hypothetical protein